AWCSFKMPMICSSENLDRFIALSPHPDDRLSSKRGHFRGARQASRALLDGPDGALAAHSVQLLALFIHELATNAASHGSLSTARGRVQVYLARQTAEWRLRPRLGEVGGPPPPPRRRKGFGTLIGDATFRKQLQGSLQRDWSEQDRS
ncbi:hypothetical protein O7A05_33850, partial [Mesorhizobium sp. Cs1330R2N1]